MFKEKSILKTLIVIAGLAVFLLACGLIDQVMEQIGPAEALVEELITDLEESVEEPVIVDEPVDIDEPADIEDPGDSELPADFALYPGAELFSVTNTGEQAWLHRYLTDDPMEEVQAFYQSQYSYLLFEGGDPCLVWDVAEEDSMQFFEELVGSGIHNLWICRTDEMYFEMAPVYGETYITADDLEALPENITVIEIMVWEGN